MGHLRGFLSLRIKLETTLLRFIETDNKRSSTPPPKKTEPKNNLSDLEWAASVGQRVDAAHEGGGEEREGGLDAGGAGQVDQPALVALLVVGAQVRRRAFDQQEVAGAAVRLAGGGRLGDALDEQRTQHASERRIGHHVKEVEEAFGVVRVDPWASE